MAENSSQKMTRDQIYTDRLMLRKIEKQDLTQLSEWSFSKEAYGDYLSPENQTFDDCFALWKNKSYWNDQAKTLIIEQKKLQAALGTIRYWKKKNDPSVALVAVKIIDRDFRCQGYGTEAQLGLIHFLFINQNLNAVEMFTDAGNLPEQRCLAKLGFIFTDIQTYEDRKIKRQGHLYRLTREEFVPKLQELLCTQ